MGFNVLARAEDLFSYPISGLVAHTKKIKEKPDEIRRVIKATIRANRIIRDNRDEAAKTLMFWGKVERVAGFQVEALNAKVVDALTTDNTRDQIVILFTETPLATVRPAISASPRNRSVVRPPPGSVAPHVPPVTAKSAKLVPVTLSLSETVAPP